MVHCTKQFIHKHGSTQSGGRAAGIWTSEFFWRFLHVCLLRSGEDLEDLVEQQLWGDSASAGAGEDGSSNDGGSSGSIGSLAAGAADDHGLAAWDVNMKALKTAAYDLGRLPNEVRQTISSGLLLSQLAHDTPAQTSPLGQALRHTPRTGLARVWLLQAACSIQPPC